MLFWSDQGVRESFIDPDFGTELRWDVPLLDGYAHCFLSAQRSIAARSAALARAIQSGPCDVVWSHGYALAHTWIAALAARGRRVPLLIRDDPTLLDERSLWRRAAKEVPLRGFRAGRTRCMSARATERTSHGTASPISDRTSCRTRSTIGTFEEKPSAFGLSELAFRPSFGLPPAVPVIAFVGKLIPKKDPLLLLRAFAQVQRQHACALLFAGDGALRRQIEDGAMHLGCRDVCITGFLNQSEVSRAYAAADVVVLPSASRETWGLVVNEAMNFNLPVVASDRVGCAPDLVHGGKNGVVFRSGDEEGLARELAALVANPDLRAAYGAASRTIVSEWSIEHTADGIVQAALQATTSEDSADTHPVGHV